MKIRRAADIVKQLESDRDKLDLFDVFVDYYFNSENLTEIVEYPEMNKITYKDFAEMCGIDI